MCNKNSRAHQRNQVSRSSARLSLSHTRKDPLTALALGVSSSVGEQERAQAAPKKTTARLFPSGRNWEEFACRIPRISSPYFTNRCKQMVAPLNGKNFCNERRLRTHTHKDPLTALEIGVSSSVDLSVSWSGNKKEQRPCPNNSFESGWR